MNRISDLKHVIACRHVPRMAPVTVARRSKMSPYAIARLLMPVLWYEIVIDDPTYLNTPVTLQMIFKDTSHGIHRFWCLREVKDRYNRERAAC